MKLAGNGKKMMVLILTVGLLAGLLAACGTKESKEPKENGSSGNTVSQNNSDTEDNQDKKDEESFTIGIGQFAEHGSLDNCREGFLE